LEAHFGYAICLAGQVGAGVDGNIGSGSGVVVGGTVPPSTTGSGRAAKRTREAGSAPGGSGGGSPGGLPSSPLEGDVPPAPPRHTLGLIWNLDSSLSCPYTLLHLLSPLGDLREGLIPFYGYPSDTQDIARRQKLLTDLGTVLQHLQTIEANPNFTTTLPNPFKD